MKLYQNNNRRINQLCNELIIKMNQDCRQIPSDGLGNHHLRDITCSITTRIDDVRDDFLLRIIKEEDKYPSIFEDNQDLLRSASIRELRYPITEYTGDDGQIKKAADARVELEQSIIKLEKEAANHLKILYLDWKEQISVLAPILAE